MEFYCVFILSIQDVLAHAVAEEMQKVYQNELGPQPVPLTVPGEAINDEDVGLFSPFVYYLLEILFCIERKGGRGGGLGPFDPMYLGSAICGCWFRHKVFFFMKKLICRESFS